MNSRTFVVIFLLFTMILAAGCAPMTPEQWDAYVQQAAVQATYAAASATQVAAAGRLATMAIETLTPLPPQPAEPAPASTPEPDVGPAAATSETTTLTGDEAPAVPLTTTAPLTATDELSETLPISAAGSSAVVAVVRSQRINVRSGPGTDFSILGNAARGDELQVLSSNENQTWWRVCCVDEQKGWVSDSIVNVQGDVETIPVAQPLMPDDLNATWAIHWECHAESCDQVECLGESQAKTLQVRSGRWLDVKREATWEGDCGEAEDWLVQVDRYTGQEQRTPASPPLFYVWEGANPGPENKIIDLLDQNLSLWCTDTRTKEVDQGDGWIVLFEGEACYDREAGILTTMQYAKRWLFSGAFGGQTYDREYFGDYELYQQILTGTNAPLSGQ